MFSRRVIPKIARKCITQIRAKSDFYQIER